MTNASPVPTISVSWNITAAKINCACMELSSSVQRVYWNSPCPARCDFTHPLNSSISWLTFTFFECVFFSWDLTVNVRRNRDTNYPHMKPVQSERVCDWTPAPRAAAQLHCDVWHLVQQQTLLLVSHLEHNGSLRIHSEWENLSQWDGLNTLQVSICLNAPSSNEHIHPLQSAVTDLHASSLTIIDWPVWYFLH